MDYFFTGKLSADQYQNHRNSALYSIKKQTNKQTNKQPQKANSVEPNRGSGAAAASRFAQAPRSRHDAACAPRVPICDAAASLEETQQIDVRGVRVRLRQVRQQRLLGSVAIDRDLRELQADTALQRWMHCSCCAQRVPRQLWPMHCAGACD